jgi:hypothetical protein
VWLVGEDEKPSCVYLECACFRQMAVRVYV